MSVGYGDSACSPGPADTLFLRCYALFNNVRRAVVAADAGGHNRPLWDGADRGGSGGGGQGAGGTPHFYYCVPQDPEESLRGTP